MVAVVAGSGVGLTNTSKEVIGGAGQWGQAELGRAQELVNVNAVSGNLMLQSRDEFLMGVGSDVSLLRTYNSLGAWDGDNGDNWRIGYYRQVSGLAGTVNTAGSSIKRIDADGFQSTFAINAALTQYIGKDGAGAFDTLTFNTATRVWTFVDGDSGNVETYAETAAGSGVFRLTQVTDPEGHAVKVAYDAAGLISTLTTWKSGAASADETVRLTYDNATNKRLTQIATTYQNELGATVTRTRVRYEYDASGRLQYVRTDLSPEDNSIADGRTYWVRYGYDAAGRVNSIVETDGSSLTIEYDASGRAWRTTDALGRVTAITYDTVNRKTTITDALTQQTVMTYDASNRLIEISGAAIGGTALKQSFAYDANDNLTSATNAQGQRTDYVYTANGALTRRTDAGGNVLERTYDTANRLLSETTYTVPDPDGAGPGVASGAQTTRYVYDTTGGKWRLRFTLSPEGRVTEHAYNTLGQRNASTTYSSVLYTAVPNPTLAQLTTWASGLAVADRAAAERREYAYDLRGQLVSVKDYPAATVSGTTVVYGTANEQRFVYDAFGRLLQSIDATGNASSYVYDGLGRITLAQNAGGAITLYQYDDAGNRTLLRRAVDDTERVEIYDAGGELISVSEGVSRQQAFSRSYVSGATADYSGLDMPASGVAFVPAAGSVQGYVALSTGDTPTTQYRTITGQRVDRFDAGNLFRVQLKLPALAVGQWFAVGADNAAGTRYHQALIRDGELFARWVDQSGVAQEVKLSSAAKPLVANTTYYVEVETGDAGSTLYVHTGNRDTGFIHRSATSDWGTARLNVSAQTSAGRTVQSVQLAAFTEHRYASPGSVLFDTTFPVTGGDAGLSGWPASSSLFTRTADGLKVDSRLAGLVNAEQTVNGDAIYGSNDSGAVSRILFRSELTTSAAPTGRNFRIGVANTGTGAAARALTARFIDGSLYADYRNAADGTWAQVLLSSATKLVKDNQTYIVEANAVQGGGALLNIYEKGTAAGAAGSFTYTLSQDVWTSARFTMSALGDQARASAVMTLGRVQEIQTNTPTTAVKTTYAYDLLGRLRAVIDGNNQRTHILYDSAGRKVADIDPTGRMVEYAYDAGGRLVQSIEYATALTALKLSTLTVAGKPAQVALGSIRPAADAAKDRIKTIYYDAAGRMIGTQDAAGYLVETRYDGASQVTDTIAYANAGTVVRIDTTSSSTTSTPPALTRPALDANNDRTTRFFYGADGLLQGSLDADGYLRELEYDAAGRKVAETAYYNATAVASRSGPLAGMRPTKNLLDRRTLYVYDTSGRLAGDLGAEGYLTTYGYDSADRLTSTTRYLATARLTVYTDGAGAVQHLASAGLGIAGLTPVDTRNEVTTRSYTVNGDLEYDVAADGTSTQYQYDVNRRLTAQRRNYTATDARATVYTYTADGQVLTETDGEGKRLQHAYDAAGLRRSTTDANNVVTVFYYDEAARLRYTIAKTTLGGEVRETVYNTFGQAERTVAYTNRLATTDTSPLTGGALTAALTTKVVALVNATQDGASTRYYDKRGLIQQAIDALSGKTDYAYTAFGQLKQSLSDVGDGRRTQFDLVYDRRGNVLSRTGDAAGLNVRTLVEYDAFGRVTATIDALGNRTATQYLKNDGAAGSGRKVVITDPALVGRTTVYDALDRTLRTIDGLGNAVTFVHDAVNRKVTATTAENIQTVTEYTRYGEVFKITDGTGAVTTYAYDRNGKLLTTTDANGNVVQNTYDGNRNLLTITTGLKSRGALAPLDDGSAVITQYTYDAANRVLTRRVNPAGLNLTTTYSYDGQGRTIKLVDAAGTTTSYAFDAKGQLKDTIVDDVTGGLKLRTSTTYDAQGRALTVTEGVGTAAARTTEYRYDVLGRRTSEIVDPNGLKLTTTYSYDAAGNVVLRCDPLAHSTRFVYDKAGRLEYTIDATGGVSQRIYDNENRLVATRAFAKRLNENNAVRLWYQTGTNSSLDRYLGRFNAGDTVTATVRFKAEAQIAGSMFLGDAGGTDPYDNYVTTVQYGTRSADGWQTMTLTRVMSHADDMWLYLYGNRDGAGAAVGDSVLYDSVQVTSTQRGSVVVDGFETDPSYGVGGNWRVSGPLAQRTLTDIALSPSALTDAQVRAAVATLGTGGDEITRIAYDKDGRRVFDVDALGNVVQYGYDAANRVVSQRTYAKAIALPTEGSEDGTTITVSGNDGYLEGPSFATIDTTRTYKVRVRLRQLSGSGTIYAGVVTKDANGAILTNPYGGTYSYAAGSAGLTPDMGWQLFEGLITGENAITASASPNKFFAGSKSAAPLLLYDYYASSGTDPTRVVEIDSLELIDVATGALVSGSKMANGVAGVFARYGSAVTGAYATAAAPMTAAQIAERLHPDAANDQTRTTVYDAAGRARYSIDSLNYVTETIYDRGGRVVANKRYANTITPPATLTEASVATALSTRLDAVNDRVEYFAYDAAGRQRFKVDAEGYASEQQLDAAGRVVATLRHAAKLTYATPPTLAQLTAATTTVTTFNTDLTGFGGTAGIWEAGQLKLISQPDVGGSWATMRSSRTFAPGASVKFDLTPTQLQNALHAGVDSPSGSFSRLAALLQPDGHVYAQCYYNGGQSAYTVDLGTYTPGTTYTVEITTSDTGATLYFYAKGTSRDSGYIHRTAAPLTWSVVATVFYTQRYPSVPSTTTAYVDNVEERGATIETNRYDAAGRLVLSVDAEGVRTQFAYDAAGRVTDRTVAVGTADASTTHYLYDAGDRMLEETRGYGTSIASTTRFRYDANGRLVAKIDPRGVADASVAGLTAAQQAAALDKYSTRYGYDALGRRTAVIDALGGVNATEYDAFGNAVKVTDARGNSGYFGFDRENRNTLFVDPEGFVVKNCYDAFGNKTASIQYANRANGTWSATALPAIVATAPGSGPYVLTDANRDATVSYLYDRLNRVTQRTDAENVFLTTNKAYETWGYDSFGNKTSYRNKNGGVFAYQFDRRGLLTKETLPITTKNSANASISVVNRYVYDSRGNRTQAIEAEGAVEQRTTSYKYDALDRLTASSGEALTTYRVGTGYTNNVVPATARSYDARGNAVTQTDGNGNVTRCYYDVLGRKVGEVNAAGTLTIWQFDAVGNAIAQRVYGDPVTPGATLPSPVNAANVRETLFAYDANNRQVEQRITGLVLGRYDGINTYQIGAPYGLDKSVVTKKYDAAGNLIKLTDGNGGITYTFYDRAGQKILEVDPEGYGVAWTHGVNGTTTRETRFAKRYGSAISEASNPSTLVSTWPVDPADRITDFTYDRDFRLVTETRLNVAYGSVNGSTGALTQSSGSAVKSYAYDGLDDKIRETDANSRVTDWAYDVAGRKTREQLPQFTDYLNASVRQTTDWEYNGLNAVVRLIRRGTNDTVETDDEITRYTYGVGGRLASQTDAMGQVTQFGYDAAGNTTLERVDTVDADANVVAQGSVHAFDAMNREVSRQSVSQMNATWSYGDKYETRYNAYGEITGKRTNGGNTAGEWQEFAEYNGLGKVLKTNAGNGITKAYLYDANGNVTASYESAGVDMRPLTIDAIVYNNPNVFQTITIYDLRNQVTTVTQPQMVAARDLADVQQFTTEQVTLSPGGGGQIGNVGGLLSTSPTGSAPPPPVLTDAQRFQPISTTVNWVSNFSTATINSITANLSVASIGQYAGSWTFMRVRIDYRLTGSTVATGTRDVVVNDRNATSATVALGLNVGQGNTNFSYTVTVSFGYAAAPEVSVGSAQFGGLLGWTTDGQVGDGEGGYTSVTIQNFAASTAFNGSFKTTDLGVVTAAAPSGTYQVWQDQVQGDLLSASVSWSPWDVGVVGQDQVVLSGVTVNLPTSSFVQTMGNFVRAVVYVDYDFSGDAYGSRTAPPITIASASTTSVYVPINYSVLVGNTTFSYTVRVNYYWTNGSKEIQLASGGVQNATIAWITTQTFSDGEGGFYNVDTQNYAGATAFNRSFYADTSNKTFFSGGSELLNATEALLYYRTSTSAAYSVLQVPRAGTLLSDTATNPSNPAGGLFYVWNSWLPPGIVDYRLVALTNGKLTASYTGNSIGATVALQGESRSQVGKIFFDTYPAIHFFDQATTRLAIQYRPTGSTGGWSYVELGAYKTEWFSWAWQAAGLSGAYDVRVLRLDPSGNITSRMFTQVNLSGAPTATALVPYSESDIAVNGQPANAANVNFRWRLAGSSNAFSSVWLTNRGNGVFGRDFSGDNLMPVVTAGSVYDYEYQYDAYDGGGQVVNSANGTFRITPNAKSFLSHNSTRLPTLVPFTIDDANALYMDIKYRVAGSTGGYTAVPRLSRASSSAQFKWDASAITPATGTADYEYEYRLYDGAGNAVLNPLGQAIVVQGKATVGTAPSQAAVTGWKITGLLTNTNFIRRYQTHNAFGEVDSETDGRGNTTNLSYNTLGLLTLRQDPTTDITGENGVTTRARPQTAWFYDRTGKAVATRDANNYVTAQQWNDGLAQAQVAKEFHVDGGQPTNAYDVFGNLRSATDGENRKTTYTYNANNLLTRLDRPVRTSGQYMAGQGASETYEYDALGQRIATTVAGFGRSRTYYDREGRVAKVTSIEGRSTSYSYAYYNYFNGAGNVNTGGWQKTTTALGGLVSYQNTDVFGRMTWQRDYGSHDTTYTYNNAGWLIQQSSTQLGVAKQNLFYEYYNNGYLKRQTDNAYALQTDYTYDENGNRIFEGYKRTDIPDGVYTNSSVVYDELNRVKTVTDPKYEIRYKYDAVGNRRNVYSYYNDGLDGNKQTQDLWYRYDGMNRFVVTMGKLIGGAIVRDTTGKLITYNRASERTTAEYYDGTANKVYLERYTYTSDGYLQDMFLSTWNGTVFVEQSQAASSRSNDLAGRVVAYVQRDASNALITNLGRTFDRDNRQTQEVDYTKLYNSAYKTDTYNYNADGTLANIATSNVQTTTTRSYTYEWWDSAKQTRIEIQAANQSVKDWAPGTSKLVYDNNGHLYRASDVKGQRTIQYITDMDGQILYRQELAARNASEWDSTNLVATGGAVAKTRSYYYLNNHGIGDVSNDGTPANRTDYAEALAQAKQRSNDDQNKKFAPSAYANFDENYQPINDAYPGISPTDYTVQNGDTLGSIAARIWGDRAMWYLIADANGLSGSETLTEGMRLVIPNKVTNIHNNAGTFKVYDAGEAIGDVSPTLPAPPPPKKHGWGWLGTILMIVIAVVVTIYTVGAAATYFGAVGTAGGAVVGAGVAGATELTLAAATTSQIFAAGAAALSGGLGLSAAVVGAAAIGGAAGSIASQGFAVATGMQDQFSWKAVGVSALGSAVTAGISGAANEFGALKYLKGSGAWESAGRAAVSSGLSQGLQGNWNWRNVMASAVGAGVGSAVGGALGDKGSLSELGQTLGGPGRDIARGLVAGAAGELAGPGGRVNFSSVFSSALGNALGDYIADPRQSSSDQDYSLRRSGRPVGLAVTPGVVDEWDRLTRVTLAAAAPEATDPVEPAADPRRFDLVYRPGVNDAVRQFTGLPATHYYLPGLVGQAFIGVGGDQYGKGAFYASKLEEILSYSQFPDATRLLDGATNGFRYMVERSRPLLGASEAAKQGYLYEESVHSLNGLTVRENVERYYRLIQQNVSNSAVVGIAMHGLADLVSHVQYNGNLNPTFDELLEMRTKTSPEGHMRQLSSVDEMSPMIAKHATTLLLGAFQLVTGATNDEMLVITRNARLNVQEVIGLAVGANGEETESNFTRSARKAVIRDIFGLNPERHSLPNFATWVVSPITMETTYAETARFLRGQDGERGWSNRDVTNFLTRGIDAAILVANDFLPKSTSGLSRPLSRASFGLDRSPAVQFGR